MQKLDGVSRDPPVFVKDAERNSNVNTTNFVSNVKKHGNEPDLLKDSYARI